MGGRFHTSQQAASESNRYANFFEPQITKFVLNPNNPGELFAVVTGSGNTQHAITIVNAASTGNLIQGNLVGTAADGTTPLGNGGIGIDLVTAPGNTIGGVGDARNVVANNNTGIPIRTGADEASGAPVLEHLRPRLDRRHRARRGDPRVRRAAP